MKQAASYIAVLFLCLLLYQREGTNAQNNGAGPNASSEELEVGAKLYRIRCQPCHMKDGKARDKKVNLADQEWKYGSSLEAIEQVIAEGIKGTAMLPYKNKLTKDQITAVAKYVLRLGVRE